MSDLLATLALYVLLVVGISVFLGIALLAFLGALGEISDWYDKRKLPKPAPRQPARPACPPHGLEHFCKADPVIALRLAELEAGLARNDAAWLAKMNRQLKVQ